MLFLAIFNLFGNFCLSEGSLSNKNGQIFGQTRSFLTFSTELSRHEINRILNTVLILHLKAMSPPPYCRNRFALQEICSNQEDLSPKMLYEILPSCSGYGDHATDMESMLQAQGTITQVWVLCRSHDDHVSGMATTPQARRTCRRFVDHFILNRRKKTSKILHWGKNF